jgi:Fur family ferric uptake transcriptional regulator
MDRAWHDHALAELQRSGHRWGRARLAVVEVLAQQACCVTAAGLADELRSAGTAPGLASIYRALELLHRLGLVVRLEVGDGQARFERALPGGEHHHHLVCGSCGGVTPFEDERLERAIHDLADRLDHAVEAHDVVLRGECTGCREADGSAS